MPTPYDFFDYQNYWKERKYEDGAERVALKRFFKKIGKKKSILDLGAGYGRLTDCYLDNADKILLVDASERMLKLSKERFKSLKKIHFLKASLTNLRLKNSSFDVVLMVRVIHHFRDSQKIIGEISRLLKPGGFLILEFANKIHFLARIKAILKGNFSYLKNFRPIDLRSKESLKERKIYFFNHHPKKIFSELFVCGFNIKEVLSVSNFRSPIIKKIIPLKSLLLLERILQKPLSFVFFGPSIFILAQKSYRT